MIGPDEGQEGRKEEDKQALEGKDSIWRLVWVGYGVKQLELDDKRDGLFGKCGKDDHLTRLEYPSAHAR